MGIGNAQKGGYIIPKRGQYAVTAADNPEWMLFLYENGITASPDYCTFEEAAAVTGFSGMTQTQVSHVDLRYFIGLNLKGDLTLDIPINNSYTTKLTLPDIAGANRIGGNAKFINRTTPSYTLIIPANVEHFSGNVINASHTHATYIFEGAVPPSHDWTDTLKGNLNNGTLDAIYVPDSAVDVYRTTNIDKSNTARYLYAQHADIIFPHSDYIEPTE